MQMDESRDPDAPGANNPRNRGGKKRLNPHCCVKPTSLMRWLCRLITPPGGLVLDPFCGSGSTGKAAILERLRFIGIDESPDYCEIARARCAWAEAHVEPEQLSLLGDQVLDFSPKPATPPEQQDLILTAQVDAESVAAAGKGRTR